MFFSGFLLLSGESKAWLFEPNNEQDCIKKYIPLAKNNVVAGLYYQACKDLHMPSPQLISKHDEVFCGCSIEKDGGYKCDLIPLNEIKDESCPLLDDPNISHLEKERIHNKFLRDIHKHYYSQLSWLEFIDRFSKEPNQEPLRAWKSKKNKAKCILNHTPLQATESELGAKMLYGEVVRKLCS